MDYKKKGFLKDSVRKVKPIEVFIGLVIGVLIVYLAYRIHTATRPLIPISVIAIIAGVVFEGRRLSDKWSTFLLKVLGSFG